MRSLHLFHMAYGIAGMDSSLLLHRCDGVVVSMWFVLLGALPFLNPELSMMPVLRRIAGR